MPFRTNIGDDVLSMFSWNEAINSSRSLSVFSLLWFELERWPEFEWAPVVFLRRRRRRLGLLALLLVAFAKVGIYVDVYSTKFCERKKRDFEIRKWTVHGFHEKKQAFFIFCAQIHTTSTKISSFRPSVAGNERLTLRMCSKSMKIKPFCGLISIVLMILICHDTELMAPH